MGITLSAIAVPTGASRETLLPAGWVKSPRPYSYIVRTSDLVFLSGLVSRRGSSADARLCVVILSAKGRARLDEIRPLTTVRERRLLDGIDEVRFKADLDRLKANAEAMLAAGLRSRPAAVRTKTSSKKSDIGGSDNE